MAAVSTPTDALVAEVLERVARAGDLAEASSIVLDRIAAEVATGRPMAMALRTERGLHVSGLEVREHRLDAVRRDEDVRLAGRIEAGIEASEPTEDRGAAAALLEAERCVFLPFSGLEDEAFGVLLLADPHDGVLGFARELLARVAPSLQRASVAQESKGRAVRLDRQRDLLTTIINELPDPVLLTDPQNNILLANRRAETLFSSAPDASPGSRSSRWPPVSRNTVRRPPGTSASPSSSSSSPAGSSPSCSRATSRPTGLAWSAAWSA